MKPSAMPSLARVSAGTEAWVMQSPGCSMSDSTPPRLSAQAKMRTALRNVRAAAAGRP